jgi:hypothetical protein
LERFSTTFIVYEKIGALLETERERGRKEGREGKLPVITVGFRCRWAFKRGYDSCATLIQQLYNNPSHEGGPQYVGPTLM